MNEREARQEILAKLREELSEEPLSIGVVGVSGVGKSTLVNTLCNTRLPTSPTTACTKEFERQDVSIKLQNGLVEEYETKLRIVDAPGLGESLKKDPEYLGMYRTELPKCDVVLWLSSARNRAVALEQHYLSELVGINDRIVFGLSQVDLIDPLNWNSKVNLPSSEQARNMEEICRDRAEKFTQATNFEISFTPVSSAQRYNLQPLFTALVEKVPHDRAWIFAGLKAFAAGDWVPEEYREQMTERSTRAGRSHGKLWPRKAVRDEHRR